MVPGLHGNRNGNRALRRDVAVTWRNWKVHFFWQERQDGTQIESLAPFQSAKYPPIPMGTGDPYQSPASQKEWAGVTGRARM